MSVSLRVRKAIALREAEATFAQEVGPAISNLGDELRERVRAKSRKDTGKGRLNVKKRVTGSGYRKRLEISGNLPQHQLDEFGRRPGAGLPPWRRGSLLFKWVGRKGLGRESIGAAREAAQRRSLRRRPDISQEGFDRAGQRAANKVQERISFLVARKINRRGIPALKPFERTRAESQQLIASTMNEAFNKATRRLNS